MRSSAVLFVATCLLAACGPRGSADGDADGTSSASDDTYPSSDTGTTTAPPTNGSGTSTSDPGTTETPSTSGQDTTTAATTTTTAIDPCPGVPVPQPPFDYDTAQVERVDVDRISVELTSEADQAGDSSYRWVFELGPDEAAPGVYTVPVEQQCYYECPNPDFTEDVVIEIFSIDECLSAAFLEVPDYNCSDFFFGCGGFVEPIL